MNVWLKSSWFWESAQFQTSPGTLWGDAVLKDYDVSRAGKLNKSTRPLAPAVSAFISPLSVPCSCSLYKGMGYGQ